MSDAKAKAERLARELARKVADQFDYTVEEVNAIADEFAPVLEKLHAALEWADVLIHPEWCGSQEHPGCEAVTAALALFDLPGEEEKR